MTEFLPCPFCGEQKFTESLVAWPATKENPNPRSTYVMMHWCKKRPGISNAFVEIRANDKAQAVKQWNERRG